MRSIPRLFAAGLFLLIGLLVFALEPVSANPNTATITGRVVNTSNQGIAGVAVNVCCVSGVQTIVYTNGNGYYTQGAVLAGRQHVQAGNLGTGLAYSHYWVDVADGQNYSNINFTLRPGLGSASGRVLDAGGSGIAGVKVDFWERSAQSTTNISNGAWAHAETDANGYYVTSITDAPGPGLPTGNYLVTFKKDGYPQRVVENVWVNAGQETKNVVVSMVTGTGSITGQVTAASNGAKLANAQVFAQGSSAQVSIFTDTNGNYSVSYLPGDTYHVVVWATGYASAHRYSVVVADGQVTPNINFALSAQQGTITGRVTNAAGSPISGASLLADSLQGNGFGIALTNANGEYTLSGLAPMEYYVHAEAPSYSALVRMEQVADGQNKPNVDFELGSYAGGISGQILKDGVPAANASLYANTSGVATVRYYRSGFTDGKGNYTLPSLPPGDYDVHVYDVPGFTPQVRFNTKVGSTVTPNINFDLSVGSAFASGYVRDPAGAPIPNATVEYFQTASPGTWQAVTTDANGYYAVSGLNEGPYNIYVSHIGYPQVTKFNVSLTANGAQINFFMGLARALITTPTGVVVMLEGSTNTSTRVLVEITSGAATTWQANTSAAWLSLGDSRDVRQADGATGEELTLRFDPVQEPYGTHTGTVTFTAPDADPYELTVTLIKVVNMWNVYMPLQAR